MDKQTEHKQWEFCSYCGVQMVPHPRVEITGQVPADGKLPDIPNIWLICPKDLEYYAMPWDDKQKLPEDQRPKQQCLPPREIVPLKQLVHGSYYRGKCRNAHVAIWNAETQKFVYMREKFDHVFPEDIGYWVEAKPGEHRFDEFRPYALMENPPFEIPLVAR